MAYKCRSCRRLVSPGGSFLSLLLLSQRVDRCCSWQMEGGSTFSWLSFSSSFCRQADQACGRIVCLANGSRR